MRLRAARYLQFVSRRHEPAITCANTAHRLFAKNALAAEVLVKMKFKRGRTTVAPGTFLAASFAQMPVQVQRWEEALQGTKAAAPATV